MHGGASSAVAFSRGKAVASFGDPRTRPELDESSSSGHHGSAFHWRDAAAHPPGNARLHLDYNFPSDLSFIFL